MNEGRSYGVKAWYAATNRDIQHVVILFQETVSFDHCFATYPNAANLDSSEPVYTAVNPSLLNKFSEA